MLEAFKIFRQHGAPRLNPNVGMCLPGMTLRSYMVMMLRAHGIPRLQWNGIGVRALGHMKPDQKGWFTALEQRVKTTTALQRLFGNSSPPELLSCYLCLYSSKDYDKFDAAWILKAKSYIHPVCMISVTAQGGIAANMPEVLSGAAHLLHDDGQHAA
jgi:hypothetical protein